MKQVRAWPEGTMDALQNCLESTDTGMSRAAVTYNQLIDVDEYATCYRENHLLSTKLKEKTQGEEHWHDNAAHGFHSTIEHVATKMASLAFNINLCNWLLDFLISWPQVFACG